MDEYFGDWMKVIDRKEVVKVISYLKTINPNALCPPLKSIFKAFELCPYRDCKVVFIGQDPYPHKGIATGILFGNKRDTKKLSPSLEVIKEAVINPEFPTSPIPFDITLESWAQQGILLINSALTVELNRVGSHTMVWRPFIAEFLKNLSNCNPGIIYVLFGQQAQTFRVYINEHVNTILTEKHPSYYARQKERMPSTVFEKVEKLTKDLYGEPIQFLISN